MLNPKIKEVYSELVVDALDELSKFFEGNNIKAYAYGVKGESLNIKAPVAILFDNYEIKDIAYEKVNDCYKFYARHLSDENDEKLAGIVSIHDKNGWEPITKEEKRILLWV